MFLLAKLNLMKVRSIELMNMLTSISMNIFQLLGVLHKICSNKKDTKVSNAKIANGLLADLRKTDISKILSQKIGMSISISFSVHSKLCFILRVNILQ